MNRLLFLLTVLLLGGCVETRFESPLGGKLESCDARWKGLWTAADPADRDAAIHVDAACKLFIVDKPNAGNSVRRIELPVRFAHADGKDYVSVEASALKDMVELEPPYGVEPPPAHSYFLARYHINAGHLQIEQPNSERVATLVIDGKLDGTVSKTHGELHVFVRGDPARMLEIVRNEPIFDGGTTTSFVRSSQTLEAFERELQRNAAKKAK